MAFFVLFISTTWEAGVEGWFALKTVVPASFIDGNKLYNKDILHRHMLIFWDIRWLNDVQKRNNKQGQGSLSSFDDNDGDDEQRVESVVEVGPN